MKDSKITAQEMNQKIESGEAQVLTVEKAKALNGKKIAYTWYGHDENAQLVHEMTVGDIISDWDLAKTDYTAKGYENRQEYWRSYMTVKQIQDQKDKFVLLDESGKDNNFLYCYSGERDNCFKEPTFTCSDADREVYYIELDED